MIRNTAWNLLAQAAPLAVAIVFMPQIVHGLGPVRFGLLALVWSLLGYFGLLDFGLGRALTRDVAAAVVSGDGGRARSVIRRGTFALAVFGGVLTLVLWAFREALTRVLDVPSSMISETSTVIGLLALAMPIVLVSAALRGALEGFSAFKAISLVRTPMALYTYVAPVVVLQAGRGLPSVVAALLVGRLLVGVVFATIVVRRTRELTKTTLEPSSFRSLLHFGSWVTVTNVVGQLLVTGDRFVLAAVASAGAVAYYATPYEMVTKLWMIPTAVVSAAFPHIVAATGDEARRALKRAGDLVIAGLFFPGAILIAFAPELLTLWMGADFAAASTTAMQVLVLGVLINSQVQAPVAYLQAQGRPEIQAISLVVQAPVFFVALFLIVARFGVTGAAAVWAARAVVDVSVANLACAKVAADRDVIVRFATIGIGIAVVAAAPMVVDSLGARAAVGGVAIGVGGVVAWRTLLDARDRSTLRGAIRRSVAMVRQL